MSCTRQRFRTKRFCWTIAAVITVAFTGVVAVSPSHADEPALLLPRLTPAIQLSQPGDLASILLAQSDRAPTDADQADAVQASEADSMVMNAARPQVKSPVAAFLMSILLAPGSGQLYAGAKMRAAIFFGMEMLGVGIYRNWDEKGNDLEDDFRVRADSTYNPWDYLAWRDSRNSRFSSITHSLPCSSFVNDAPSSLPVPQAIRDCPSTDKQQFYELIGKYDQFVSGWEDVRENDTGNLVVSTEVDSAENFQSATRLSYEVDRNESNKYLKRASVILGPLFINRVFSAIDAARVAHARNLGQDEAIIDRRTRFSVALGGSAGTTPMLMAYRPFQ
jgi:hypothetical protein